MADCLAASLAFSAVSVELQGLTRFCLYRRSSRFISIYTFLSWIPFNCGSEDWEKGDPERHAGFKGEASGRQYVLQCHVVAMRIRSLGKTFPMAGVWLTLVEASSLAPVALSTWYGLPYAIQIAEANHRLYYIPSVDKSIDICIPVAGFYQRERTSGEGTRACAVGLLVNCATLFR